MSALVLSPRHSQTSASAQNRGHSGHSQTSANAQKRGQSAVSSGHSDSGHSQGPAVRHRLSPRSLTERAVLTCRRTSLHETFESRLNVPRAAPTSLHDTPESHRTHVRHVSTCRAHLSRLEMCLFGSKRVFRETLECQLETLECQLRGVPTVVRNGRNARFNSPAYLFP